MINKINWVTDNIAVGPYPDREKMEELNTNGITQILNVCEIKNIQPDSKLDLEIDQLPLRDGFLIPMKDALKLMELMHQYIAEGKKVYVHCVAGQHRSPTVIWLYLISLGYSLEKAGELISDASIDAVPGHPHMFNMELIKTICDKFNV